jgi:hypothetical protein
VRTRRWAHSSGIRRGRRRLARNVAHAYGERVRGNRSIAGRAQLVDARLGELQSSATVEPRRRAANERARHRPAVGAVGADPPVANAHRERDPGCDMGGPAEA